MKTVLFVPGFKENMKSRDYESSIKAIEGRGCKVHFIPIKWNRTTIDDWLDELEIEYAKHNPKETILAGFSFGAMTAFVAAAKRNPSELWLFSLSPYFHEDIHSKYMKKSWLSHIGHRRVSAFDRLTFNDLAKSIYCRTLIFAGETELNKWPDMKHRALSAEKYIRESKLLIVDGVGHDIADRQYVNTLRQTI